MSGGSSANNSWTILTPEETETLRPLAEETVHHEESLTSETGSKEPARGAEGLSMEGHQVSERPAELSGDTKTVQDASQPTAVTEAPVPTSLEEPIVSAPGSDSFSQSEGLPEGPSQSSHDPESFSDSYTHITPSSDDTRLSTETLGGVEITQGEEKVTQEGMLHPLNGEGRLQEEEESEPSHRITGVRKQSDSPVDPEVGEQSTEKTGEEEEPDVRRRSLLAALERIGKTEDEEELDEEFQPPQQGKDSGFPLNKCILGALILLGLGTIFFSGVFMDLDEESDYGTRELRDTELPGNQEWLNPEVSPPPLDAENAELLNKLAEGNQQMSLLQAQLQAQTEELNVAKGQAAEGAKERLRWEEVEKENSRLKKEAASLHVLQKENERMKRQLESVLAQQKELETLRSAVPESKLSSAHEAVQEPVNHTASPPSGQPEDNMKATAGFTERQPRKSWSNQTEKKKNEKDGEDIGEKEEKERKISKWKEGDQKERKEGGKSEWNKVKHEQGKFVKDKDKEGKHSDEAKQWKVEDWKKDKARRGDQGKSWKDREGKEDWKDKSDRKLTEGKDWKKDKHEKVGEGKRWGNEKENGDWKLRKEHEHKDRKERKGEKEGKKGKDGYKERSKNKWEKKEWKEKGEKKEWKKDSKDYSKEGKWRGERKQWEEKKNGKENKGKDERKRWNKNEWKSKCSNNDKEWKRKEWEKKEEQLKRGRQEKMKDWTKDKTRSHRYKRTSDPGHEEEHLWGDGKPVQTHHRPSLEQPQDWIRQRDRLQHSSRPLQHCSSMETCAQAEGLLPVLFPEFQNILHTYLAKAEEAGADATRQEELKKLTAEFFKEGVFVHDRMSFRDFVEDLGEVLEDMVEGDDMDGEDSAIEEEMEGFGRAAMKRFSVPGAGAKEKRSKAEWKKESGRGHG